MLGVEAETLRCMAEDRPEHRIVLDLRQVHAMDAAGLGLLVDLHCRAQQRDRSVTVSHASPRVRRLLSLTNLNALLQFSDLDALELALAGERAMTA